MDLLSWLPVILSFCHSTPGETETELAGLGINASKPQIPL